MPNLMLYDIVNLLWPARMLGVYDYSVPTLVILNVLIVATIGLIAAAFSNFLHFTVGYLIAAAWGVYVWLYFSGFDVQAGHKLPLVVALFIQVSAWALAAQVRKN